MSRIFCSRKFSITLACLFFLAILLRVWSLSWTDITALEKIISGETTVPIRTVGGAEIYTYTSPTYGQKIAISLDEVSDELIAATIATEDKTFFTNPGFSPIAIIRAFLQNLRMRQTYSGASTITQQIVRNILLSPEERFDRTYFRKIKEIFLAFRVTLKYDKRTILTLYLNEIYYGQNATGVEMAAQVYFGKHASELDLAEAAFIAGLPQGPNYYGIDGGAGVRRQREVLQVMKRIIEEDRCIPISGGKNHRLFCPTEEELNAAMFHY